MALARSKSGFRKSRRTILLVVDSQADVPPGWYPDPTNGGQQRWWDGAKWGGFAGPFIPVQPEQYASGSSQAVQTPTTWMSPYAASQSGLSSDDRTVAVLTHVSMLFFGFICPLVVYLVYKDKDPFVRHHAAEALNFYITLLCWIAAGMVLMLVVVGFFVLIGVVGFAFVMPIVGAVAASKGKWYRFPLIFRFVPGAMPA